MKIALIGASGRVGAKVLAEALSRGHQVTAVVRNTEKLKPAKNLTIAKGDAYDAATVARLVAGHDAVISAFNPGWTDPHIRANSTKGMKSIIDGLRKAGVRRVLFVGGAGSLIEPDGSRGVDSPHFPAAWKAGALGAADALDMVRQVTDLEWTFLSPAAMLNPGEKTGKYRLGKDSLVKDAGGASNISEGDLAHAIVDEIEKPKHIRQRFTLGY
jgi:putative NADH-flavin reductase